MIDIVERIGINNAIGLRSSGKLAHEDYQRVIPVLDQMIEKHGNLRIVIFIESFQGMELRAIFDELRFDISHWKKFHKIAIVSSKKWTNSMTKLSNMVMKGEIKHFDDSQEDEAWQWVSE